MLKPALVAGFASAPNQPLESFNTKNRYKKLDFLAWFGTTCDSFLLVLKKTTLYRDWYKGGVVLY